MAIRLPIKELDASEYLPPEVSGARVFRAGRCGVILGREVGRWHISISHPNRYPTWDEIRYIRYALVPDEAFMGMLLPRKKDYVNLHENCFHLWEIKDPHLQEVTTEGI